MRVHSERQSSMVSMSMISMSMISMSMERINLNLKLMNYYLILSNPIVSITGDCMEVYGNALPAAFNFFRFMYSFSA